MPHTRHWILDDGSWVDDEDVAMQLNAYAAISDELEVDEVGEEYAEAVQLAYAATNTESGERQRQRQRKGQRMVKENPVASW